MMREIKGGVTAAKGFEAAGTAAGIKRSGKMDMAMVYSEAPCVAAGTFTSNLVKAAPVKWDQRVIESGESVQAVVVNSGIANACTGEEGLGRCEETARAAAESLGISPAGILVGSTGVIGKQLPMDKLVKGVAVLAGKKNGSLESGTEAAEAIKTTDTFEKELAVEVEIGGKMVTVGGMAKGSGMIHPNMCTLLSFVTTDAVISRDTLQEALSADVQDTYNMISVDGDTSTNDTCIVLANGRAGNPEIVSGTEGYRAFAQALHAVNEYLAKKIAADGEGAAALLEVKAIHCESKEQARTIAKSIVCSNLVKTAVAGHDANWGRILCAMGYSGAAFDPESVDLYFESRAGKIQITSDSTAVDYSEEEATKILSEPEVRAIVDIKAGDAQAAAWGCDLTHGYININADYRS